MKNHIKLKEISIKVQQKKYFAKFFEEHNSNVKKTLDRIRDLINVTKKKSTNISKLSNDKILNDNYAIANEMNNFFVNIGSTVEAKIPPSNNPSMLT